MSDIQVGDVLYLYNAQMNYPDFKYSICVHISPYYFFVINTENRKMYNCIPLMRKSNPYLDHDSYIGCANYFKFDTRELKDKRIVGRLGYEDLKKLYTHIKDNVKSLPKQVKDDILKSLNNALDDMH